MALSRVHVWSAGEVLTAIDLNAEFNSILTNASDLITPFTKAISLSGFALDFDMANTIAMTATTSGVNMTGGTLREPTEDTITAFAGGGQGSATALSLAKKYHRITVCASSGDSVLLPASSAGQAHYVRNDGAAAAKVFGTSPDTVNGVATATGVFLPASTGVWYVCTTAGNWTTGPLVAISGNFATTLTATAATNVTLPVTGTLATLAGSEALTNKTVNGLTITSTNGTLTLVNGSSIVTAGAFAITLTSTGATGVTLPTSGTLATLAGAEALTNKTFAVASNSLNMAPITASLGADVDLNNAANYFDGPSIAQGTSGTWFVSGTVTVDDTVGAAGMLAKLWDGTTVIASAEGFVQSATRPDVIALSGFIASPAGNLRISVKDPSSTTGKIRFNSTGNSKDSTITAIRIA